jgi:hypothetical protein
MTAAATAATATTLGEIGVRIHRTYHIYTLCADTRVLASIVVGSKLLRVCTCKEARSKDKEKEWCGVVRSNTGTRTTSRVTGLISL